MIYMSVLKALADETRLNILKLLLHHRYCVRAIAGRLALSEASVSQHLKVLKEAGLVKGERHGYFIHYDVRRNVLEEISTYIGTLADIKRDTDELAPGDSNNIGIKD